MKKNRMEAFSDGVIAIIITIMVLELKVPHGGNFFDIEPLIPVFMSYVLSFVFVGIYWNSHHHVMHATTKVNGRMLWANLHFLFWLSLIPFVTAWMGENDMAPWTVAIYGLDLFLVCVSHYVFEHVIIDHHGKDSLISKAIGIDKKGIATISIYFFAVPLAFVSTNSVCIMYASVALIWLIPNRRIEMLITSGELNQ